MHSYEEIQFLKHFPHLYHYVYKSSDISGDTFVKLSKNFLLGTLKAHQAQQTV